ncbi:hypothetical protein L484_014768 [Morus notabilis]|uniref:Uncharacterized protein n=1 Tax=Morus notabilis TaxID=981085 RepID=W9SI30_9ROSA|nr:hypothetical protein L484_014768 [Morus notabilis]
MHGHLCLIMDIHLCLLDPVHVPLLATNKVSGELSKRFVRRHTVYLFRLVDLPVAMERRNLISRPPSPKGGTALKLPFYYRVLLLR